MMQILIKIKVIFLSKTRNSGFKLWERAIERYFINVSLCDELEPDGKVLGFLLPGYQLRGLNSVWLLRCSLFCHTLICKL